MSHAPFNESMSRGMSMSHGIFEGTSLTASGPFSTRYRVETTSFQNSRARIHEDASDTMLRGSATIFEDTSSLPASGPFSTLSDVEIPNQLNTRVSTYEDGMSRGSATIFEDTSRAASGPFSTLYDVEIPNELNTWAPINEDRVLRGSATIFEATSLNAGGPFSTFFDNTALANVQNIRVYTHEDGMLRGSAPTLEDKAPFGIENIATNTNLYEDRKSARVNIQSQIRDPNPFEDETLIFENKMSSDFYEDKNSAFRNLHENSYVAAGATFVNAMSGATTFDKDETPALIDFCDDSAHNSGV